MSNTEIIVTATTLFSAPDRQISRPIGDPMLNHANGLLLWYAKSCVANPGGYWEFAGVYIGGATVLETLKLLLHLELYSPTLTVKSRAPWVIPC